MLTFSNPRLHAEFDNWPCGGERVKCVFRVHHDRRGWRVERRTTNKHGKWCKPKYTTYSGQAAIVDGSDGKTYILQVAAPYGFVCVKRSDFMDATKEMGGEPGFGASSVFADKNPELLALILKGGALVQALPSEQPQPWAWKPNTFAIGDQHHVSR